MSALPPKVDINAHRLECLLCAISGHFAPESSTAGGATRMMVFSLIQRFVSTGWDRPFSSTGDQIG